MNAFDPFDHLFNPANPCFTVEGLRTLINLQLDDATEAKMELLGDKANEGTLTPEERREYESMVRSGIFISMLQAKARLYQKRFVAA